MSWENRIGDMIEFTSPKGRFFEALWSGSNRTKTKKIGSFSPPRKSGTVIQDLGIGSTVYPLTFIFDGENHDLIARLFFETCSEEGTWEIDHPIHGILELQLMTITEKNQPVSSANLTEIESEWIEPLKEDQTLSSAELAALIEFQINALNLASAAQLAAIASQTTASRIQALKNAAAAATNAINSGLASISKLSADISRITNSIQRATTSNLANPLVAINSLATQIQIAAQAPSLAISNVQSRADSYASAIDTLLGGNPTDATPENKNFMAVKEISLISMAATLPRIASTGALNTRLDAVNLAVSMSDLLDTMTNDLDEAQKTYENNLLENQYFSQSSSYSDLVKLIGLGIEYLLRASFDLKVEKVITLKKPRTPIDITISEYGELGDNDSNLDFFIESNKLKNLDILLLEAGREVVVYV